MRSQQFSQTALIRPRSQFWPIDRYRKKYGSPSSNRKLRHKKVTIDGIVGVVVPGDNGEGPWELETKSGTRLELNEDEDVGSSGGEEAIAQAKYKDLATQQKSFLSELAQGAMQEALQECALDDEAQQKEAARSKRKKALRRPRKEQEQREQAGLQKTAFMRDALTSDEDNADVQAAGAASRAKPVRQPAPKSGARRESAAQQSGTASASSAGGAGASQATADGKPIRGAPKKVPAAMEASLWAEFKQADSRSLYFNKNSDVQRRMVTRWSNTCRTKAASAASEADKISMEASAKRLQIIETAIKMHRGFVHRTTDAERSFLEFEAAWASLLQFTNSDPVQTLDCPFLWEFRLELQVAKHSRIAQLKLRLIRGVETQYFRGNTDSQQRSKHFSRDVCVVFWVRFSRLQVSLGTPPLPPPPS